jgi:hypothetical protein
LSNDWKALVVILPFLGMVALVIYWHWAVRQLAIRHGELGRAITPSFPWPSVRTSFFRVRKSTTSAAFQREYIALVRPIWIAWLLFFIAFAAGGLLLDSTVDIPRTDVEEVVKLSALPGEPACRYRSSA